MALGKRAALGHFVLSGRALFPSGIFQLCSTNYKGFECDIYFKTMDATEVLADRVVGLNGRILEGLNLKQINGTKRGLNCCGVIL